MFIMLNLESLPMSVLYYDENTARLYDTSPTNIEELHDLYVMRMGYVGC